MASRWETTGSFTWRDMKDLIIEPQRIGPRWHSQITISGVIFYSQVSYVTKDEIEREIKMVKTIIEGQL